MTGTFAAYPIEINGIKSQGEWDEVKDTVTAYIAADKIAPTDTQTTDKNGIVKFENWRLAACKMPNELIPRAFCMAGFLEKEDAN